MPRGAIPNANGYRHSNCGSFGHADGNGNSGCKRYAYSYGDGNSNCNCNSNTDAHTYGYSHGHANTDANADSHGYGNTDGNSHSAAEAYTDAEAAFDTAATSLALVENLKAGTRERKLASSPAAVQVHLSATENKTRKGGDITLRCPRSAFNAARHTYYEKEILQSLRLF